MTLRLRRRYDDALRTEQAAIVARLAETFHFNAHDLYQNQVGCLSAAQRQRLAQQTHRTERRAAWVIVALVAGMLALGGPARMGLALGLLALYGVVWAVLGVLRRTMTPLARDLRAGEVRHVQGRLGFRFPVRGSDTQELHGSYAMVEINGMGYRITPEQYIALYKHYQQDPQGFFAAYYLPHTHTLLSVEPIIVNVEHFYRR